MSVSANCESITLPATNGRMIAKEPCQSVNPALFFSASIVLVKPKLGHY
jgi:hypothetical protein